MDKIKNKLCGRCNKPKGGAKGEDDGFCNCGRPTKYTTDEDMIFKIDEYLKTCIDEYNSETKRLKVKLPMLEDFALFIGITDVTLVEWRKEHQKFSSAVRKIEIEQKKRLINSGLSEDYNSTIAKLNLSANHGMREGQDITTNNKDIQSVNIKFYE